MSAISDIADERRRQITDEGFRAAHDDEHNDGGLLAAACCYAQRRMDEDRFGRQALTDKPPAAWPWSPEWWKPKDRRRDLVRAAALIAAEIDRMDRAEIGGTDPQPAAAPAEQ